MVVRVQNGSVLLRDQAVATSSGCCCGQCPPGETKCASDCCTQEQTCCSGSCCDTVCCNGVCCQPGELCIGGECIQPCSCPDYCMFQMQATGPISTPLWPPFSCELPSPLDAYVAEDDSAVVDCGVEGNFVAGPVGFVLVRTYESKMRFSKQFLAPELLNDAGIPSYFAEYEAGALIRCDLAEGRLRLFLEVYYQIRVAFIDSAVPEGAYGERHIAWLAIKEMPSDCIVVQRPNCGVAEPRRVVFMNAPFEIEASLDSFSGDEILGVTDETIGDQTYVGPCADAIAESFNPSFLVVQRPSCPGVPCTCGTNLNGMRATFDGREFTLGTPHTITEGNTRWQHEIDGTGSYNFYRDTFLPENVDCGLGSFSVPVELITLSLYCGTDSTAVPPVQRWLVDATTVCAPTNVVDCGLVATGFAQRLFNAHIRCGEAAPGCVGPAGGSHIPMGSVVDIVEADGSPFLNPDLPDCGASEFPSFSVGQNCFA